MKEKHRPGPTVSSIEHFPIQERLHTDVLEDKYGPIHAKVLRHNSNVREVHLMDQENISRTYAITLFTHQDINPEIEKIIEEIKQGEPIGKAFRNHHYSIRKNVTDVFTMHLPEWLQKDFAQNNKFAEARLSEFYAKRENEKPCIYGTVVEIYSPDFRSPVVNAIDISQINPSTAAFEQAGINTQQAWDKLGANNNWSGMADKYEEAKEKKPSTY